MASLNSWALTTVADVKETLGIDSGDSTKNNLIIRKINQATDMIEGYTGRNSTQHLASTLYTNEEYDGTNTKQLSLKNKPVITFSQLQQRSTVSNESDWDTVDTDLYFVDNDAGVIDSLFTFLYHWNIYRVTYTAGYASIPYDLSEAAATLAAYLVDNAATGAGVKKKDQGPKSIEYFQSNQQGSLIESLGLDDSLARYMLLNILEDK